MQLILFLTFLIANSNSSPTTRKPNLIESALQKAVEYMFKEYYKFNQEKRQKIIIAHRGASGYLPEHTLEAKVLAYQMGADYIEQDLVLTKDDEIVIVHDLYLDGISDVMEVFPGRNRNDGHFYVIDFTLEEIRTLKTTVNFNFDENGNPKAKYPDRFPLWKSSFGIHTFEEEIELIQGMNKVLGKNVGIYPEIKKPWFHRQEGKDISIIALKMIKNYGYTTKRDKIYLQCFDPNELIIIHDQLLPQLGMDLKLAQLMSETAWAETYELVNGQWKIYNYDWMFEKDAMKKIAKYADGISPWFPMVITNDLVKTDLVDRAHNNHLVVHAYTFRADQGEIPSYATSFEHMLDIFFNEGNIDAVFTDFPDKAVKWRDNN